MRITKLLKPTLTAIGLASLGLLLLFPGKSSAANPTTINFQGKIVNADGTNVANSTYSIVFRIYNTASPVMTTACTSTATCLWQETQASVTVTNGVFQVELGSACALTSASCNNTAGGPINFSTSNSLYLTMQFNGDTSGSNGGFMSPTMHITSVPFAFQADNSSTLGGIAASGFIQNNSGSAQATSSFHISNTGIADVQLQSPLFDTATSNGTLGVGSTNAGVITIGNITNSTVLFKTKNTTATFQVQNGSGNQVLTVDASATEANNFVTFGKASTINGRMIFDNSTNANTITIVSGATVASGGSGYSLTLPTTGASGTQCLQSTSGSTVGATVLTFSSCGSGGTLASTYNSAATTGNTITYSTAGAGIIIQDASTPLTGNMLTLQNNTGTINFLTFNLVSSVPHLRVYDQTTNTNYADIYYDHASSSAIFTANSGTTKVGSGTGSVTIQASTGNAVTISADANSSFTTTTGFVRLDGPSGIELGTASSRNGTLAFINLTNTNLISITVPSGASAPAAAYTLTLPGSAGSPNQCLQNSGTAGILTFNACGSGSGTALSINGTSVGSTANFVNTTASGTATGVTYTNSTGTISTAIGNASTTTAGAVTNGSQSFAGDKIFQSTTNSNTAFQLQNATAEPIFLADTTSTDNAGAQVNFLSYSGFESGSFSNAAAGWAAVNPTGGTTTLTQNTSKQHTFNGLFSASVAIGANTSGGGGLHTGTGSFVSAPPGSTTYLVSFYAKISTGTIASTAFTVTTTGGAGSCSPAAGITINASGFQRLSCSLAAGAGSITDFKIADNVTTAHTLYIDSVQLQDNTYNGVTITAPTAYQLGEIQIRGVVTNPLILANNGDSTSAFQIQKTNGSAIITADTLNSQVLLGTASSLNGTLTFNNSTNANTVSIVTGATTTTYNIILPTAAATTANYCLVMSSTGTGATSWTACGASSTATITLVPEFPGAVMTGDGTSNVGTMTSDFCSNTVGSLPALTTGCNSGQTHNFYAWTANATNDYEIFVKWAAPSDFASFSAVTFNGWRTSTSDAVTLTIYNAAGTSCGSASIAGTVATWNNGTSVSTAGCSAPSPGDILTLDTHLSVGVNSEFARMGEITITYNRK